MKKNKKKEKLKRTEITLENDIKYEGPLSYRSLRIIAWFAIIIAQVAIIINLNANLSLQEGEEEISKGMQILILILLYISQLSLPLFLIANFSIIINNRESYLKLLIKYGGISLAFILAFIFINFHYVSGIVSALGVKDKADVVDGIMDLFFSKIVNQNVMLDLFLCTLTLFFIDYNPKKYFQGKKIIVFRSFVLLPIAYEIFAIIIKILSITTSSIPTIFQIFLPTKPILLFLLFIAIIIYIKVIERMFKKRGKTKEEYVAYTKTNHAAFRFSIFTSICLAVISVIDIAVVAICNSAIEDSELFYSLLSSIIGSCSLIFLAIPIVMFFSYKKTHKNTTIDIFIPLAGIALLIFTYLEGGYWIIVNFLTK